jgi:Heparinase II/III-like protein
MPAVAKTGRTYYTDAKLAIMRSNLEKYDWAREERAGILAEADRWARYNDERLRTLVIPPRVPRCYEVHNMGCPVHGLEINRRRLYDWGVDFDRPFKIKCPVGGEEYPSNDFAAFLAGGMKDRSLLTGDYADDGWGWHKAGDPTRAYWFVAYYAHWSMVKFLFPAITALGKAAVVAPDPELARLYAHKCALLLWQMAVYYPDYDYNTQSREAKEHNPKYTGKITNMIWEIWTPDSTGPAYDAVWPYLIEDRELQKLAGLDGKGLDEFIRERLLMEAARCIYSGSGRIRGNYGVHQRSLLTLAAVLDEKEKHPTSREMVNWVLANPQPITNVDMGVLDALENLLYRDGMPYESPGYNIGWVVSLSDVAAALTDLGVNLFQRPRFHKLLSWPFDITAVGKYEPPIGDTGDMFSQSGLLPPATCRQALPYVHDPRLADVIRKNPAGGRTLFSQPMDTLFDQYPPEKMEPLGIKSFHFPGYGLALLQSGSETNRTASILSYGDWRNHVHYDQLNLLLYSWDNPLLCDVGYPEQTDNFNWKLFGFWTNTTCHNTVMVDATRMGRGPAKLYAYEPNGFAQVVEASAEAAYKDKVSLFRRADIQVEVSPTQSYVFDAFYVRGGKQHDFILMGTQADFTCEPTLGQVQEKGTLAGLDVPYEQFYDDPNFKDKPLGSVAYPGYRGSGFQYFYNVQRALLTGQGLAEWKLTEPGPEQDRTRAWQGIGLRAHMVGMDEIIACDGKPQGYKHLPRSVKFMLRRRVGENLSSRYVTVFEPYKDQSWIESVTAARMEPEDGDAAAVLVELRDGSKHYCFHSLNPGRKYILDGKVTADGQAACLVLDAKGAVARAMLLNGTRLSYGRFVVKSAGLRKSRIVTIDYAKGIIELADPVLPKGLKVPQTVLVAQDTFADCLTMRAVLGKRRFSIGDEDLVVGGGPVTGVVADKSRLVTTVASPFAQAGMTVLNSRFEAQGRVGSGDRWTLDRVGLPPLKAEDFPAGEGGLGSRFSIVCAGPGDEVVIPGFVSLTRTAKGTYEMTATAPVRLSVPVHRPKE